MSSQPPLASNMLTLICWVFDDKSAFPVDISPEKTIGHLKKAIVAEKPNRFHGIDADTLMLWKAEILDEDEAIKAFDINDAIEMRSSYEIGEYFKGPPKKHIHVVIQVPAPTPAPAVPDTTKQKQLITEAFPKGLQYIKPTPLLDTNGAQWDYQPGEKLHGILRWHLRKRYKHYLQGKMDKGYYPLYFFAAGAGTGKSRHGTEFHHTITMCLEKEDDELKKKLEEAWVFLVSLENGNSLLRDEVKDPFTAIGTRMLLQLLPNPLQLRPNQKLRNIVRDYEVPHPLDVLNLVAQYHNRCLEDATIILVVDGLQQIMDNKHFATTLRCIGDLGSGSPGPFLIPCCTATVFGPASEAFGYSSRPRILLPVNPLDPPLVAKQPVFETDDPIIKLLVSDCGGHGRALEILAEIIGENSNQDFNIGELMGKLRDRLFQRYPAVLKLKLEEANALILAIVTHQRLYTNHLVPHTEKTPEQLVSAGLVSFVEDIPGAGYLVAPYIWVWTVAVYLTSLFSGWKFDDYDENATKFDNTAKLAICTWEDFERFNAFFRVLKSKALPENSPTKISEFHHGAQLKGEIEFRNHHLEWETAVKQANSKSSSQSSILCQKSSVKVQDNRHFILNAKSAPFGDGFCGLDTEGRRNEVHQYKYYQHTQVTQEIFNKERKKATSHDDFFLFITTAKDPKIELPELSGIVHGGNWKDYFGPFAGRMFLDIEDHTFEINKATFPILQLVVGRENAAKIIEKRPFADISHAGNETKIGESLLKKFKYSESG